MSRADILSSWELVKDTPFGQWLQTETDKVLAESTVQMDTLGELVPIARVQGMRAGVQHWRSELDDMRRKNDYETNKKKPGFLSRFVALGGKS